jgi:hypothetical protein
MPKTSKVIFQHQNKKKIKKMVSTSMNSHKTVIYYGSDSAFDAAKIFNYVLDVLSFIKKENP